MNSFEIIIIALFILVVFLKIKKYIQTRNIVNYTVKETAEKIKNNKNTILLDVRTDIERNRGHIKGSIHVPLHMLKTDTNTLNKYKNMEIICYCQSGSRSVSAVLLLNKLGFNAANMIGGYSRWN